MTTAKIPLGLGCPIERNGGYYLDIGEAPFTLEIGWVGVHLCGVFRSVFWAGNLTVV